MASEAELDAALTALAGHVSEIQTAAQSIIDKVQNLPGVPDLSDEINTINNLSGNVADTTAAINAAVAPPA